MTEPNGILLVDKPAGWTSHDVVARIRSRFRIGKVGHCGTLDPNATGLLVLVLGRATKLSDRLISEDKTYEGIIRLGEVTDSHDADGELQESREVPRLTREDLDRIASGFTGDMLQKPPMVSAVKVGGVPLYKLARKGRTVERQPRLIHIYRFRIPDYAPPDARFSISCTKGVYVRSLAHDLGERIGCGAHLRSLRRLRSGDFTLEEALPLDDLVKMTPEAFARRIIPASRLARR